MLTFEEVKKIGGAVNEIFENFIDVDFEKEYGKQCNLLEYVFYLRRLQSHQRFVPSVERFIKNKVVVNKSKNNEGDFCWNGSLPPGGSEKVELKHTVVDSSNVYPNIVQIRPKHKDTDLLWIVINLLNKNLLFYYVPYNKLMEECKTFNNAHSDVSVKSEKRKTFNNEQELKEWNKKYLIPSDIEKKLGLNKLR